MVFEKFAAEPGYYWSSISPNFVAQPHEFEAVQLVEQLQTGVHIFCVDFWELSHLTRDLSQAEKKRNVVTSWANAQNDIHFTQRFYQRWLDKRIYKTEMKFGAVLGSWGCREKKLPTAISKQLFQVVFSTFCGQNKFLKNF